jgi:hypothetical protein
MDETIYEEQLAQLDPELRAQLEAWLEEQAQAQAHALPDDDLTEAELRELMEEPAGGHNYGRTGWNGPASSGPGDDFHGDHQPADLATVRLGGADEPWRAGRTLGRKLSVEECVEADFLAGHELHGWSLVETSRGSGGFSTHGAGDAGMTAHRGIVQPGMYVNSELLRAMVEDELGFTRAEFQRVSGGGRPRKVHEALNRRINARLAELQGQGANFAVLAPVLGCTPQALGQRAKAGETFRSHA